MSPEGSSEGHDSIWNKRVTRREFLKVSAAATVLAGTEQSRRLEVEKHPGYFGVFNLFDYIVTKEGQAAIGDGKVWCVSTNPYRFVTAAHCLSPELKHRREYAMISHPGWPRAADGRSRGMAVYPIPGCVWSDIDLAVLSFKSSADRTPDNIQIHSLAVDWELSLAHHPVPGEAVETLDFHDRDHAQPALEHGRLNELGHMSELDKNGEFTGNLEPWFAYQALLFVNQGMSGGPVFNEHHQVIGTLVRMDPQMTRLRMAYVRPASYLKERLETVGVSVSSFQR